MKKIVSLLMALLLALPFSVFSATVSFAQTEAVATDSGTKTVYVSDSGSDTNSGESADAPFRLMSMAYAALGDEGGIIKIVGTVTNEVYSGLEGYTAIANGFWEPAHSGKIIIEGYDDTSKFYLMNDGTTVKSRFFLSGDTEFRNLIIYHDNGGIMGACHNTMTMGEGLTMQGAGTLYLYGGCNEVAPKIQNAAHTTHDTHIVLKSGTYHAIVGGGGNSSTSLCHATGAVHTVEVLGDIKVNTIIPGHNKTDSTGITANIIIDSNISINSTNTGIFIGGFTGYPIGRVNVLLLGGSVTGLTVNSSLYASGAPLNIYYDSENTEASALVDTITANASANATVTKSTPDAYCTEVLGAHAYGTDNICTYCGNVSECAHENTQDITDKAATCVSTGIYHTVCSDCGSTVAENIEIATDPTAHGVLILDKGEAGYDLVCSDCGVATVNAVTDSAEIYVSDNGTGTYGFTADDAISDITAAYTLLSRTGGKMLVTDSITTVSNYYNAVSGTYAFAEPTHEHITLTSADGAASTVNINTSALHWYMSGELTVENITVNCDKGVVLCARHHHLTMGEGVVTSFPSGVGLWLVGCCQQGGENECESYDTHMSIYSGTYANIIGGHRTVNSSIAAVEGHGTATHYIDILGDVTVSGYFTGANTYVAANDVVITIDGNLTTGGYFYFAGINTTIASVNNVTVFLRSGSISALGTGTNAFPGGTSRLKGAGKVYYSNTTDAAALLEVFGGVGGKYVAGRISQYCIDSAGEHSYTDGVCDTCGRTPAVLGDLDNDTAITNSDITMMVRLLSGWVLDHDAEALDYDQNGKLNNRDVFGLIKALTAVEQ